MRCTCFTGDWQQERSKAEFGETIFPYQPLDGLCRFGIKTGCSLHCSGKEGRYFVQIMQSALVYGRLIVRALTGSVAYDASASLEYREQRQKCLRLITASCGFSKDSTAASAVNVVNQVFKRDTFGDDACFVAKYKHRDVLGRSSIASWYCYC